jgi:nucleotide-binding universal stress UspA family protein
MKRAFPPASIVVGVDGSKASVEAAVWAVDEAVDRDIPLRLVNVMTRHSEVKQHSRGLDRDYAHAERITHQAWSAVEATGKPVKLEMEILRGQPASMLAQASRSAAMVCIGWTGISSAVGLGSTASALSRSAHCPVAVIRLQAGASLDGRWIIAKVDEPFSSDAVLHRAIEEARLRRAPLLALTSGLDRDGVDTGTAHAVHMHLDDHRAQLSAHSAEVSVCSLPVSLGVLDYLAKNADLAQLLVVGADDPRVVTELTGTNPNAVLHHTNCSVMSVRGRLAE